jgi:GH35 family endo-1,4-beta-xylanase
MNSSANDLLKSAEERIRQVRTAEITLCLMDGDGVPVQNAAVEVNLVNHAFKFGCNAFGLRSISDGDLQRAYEARFAALFNYGTLPYYWARYERRPGEIAADHLARMATWCQEHRVAAKGHPLVWHEVYPRWAQALPDDQVLELLEARVRAIPREFEHSVHIWDVVNEATVAHRFDNAIGRWIAREGTAAVVEQALRWAREASPKATLLYNDFNISAEFEQLVADLLDHDAPVDATGIQSHMHKGPWSLERVWSVCETYARFGLPLHFTELTVLSGRLKAADDDDWHTPQTDWKTTPEGEAAQAEYGEQLYTLLFSHPVVEAITWWDFADHHAWQGAPAGMLREDMSPKPLYERLHDLVSGTWNTQINAVSDEQGTVRCRCFYGEHQVQVTLASGVVLERAFRLRRDGERTIEITI